MSLCPLKPREHRGRCWDGGPVEKIAPWRSCAAWGALDGRPRPFRQQRPPVAITCRYAPQSRSSCVLEPDPRGRNLIGRGRCACRQILEAWALRHGISAAAFGPIRTVLPAEWPKGRRANQPGASGRSSSSVRAGFGHGMDRKVRRRSALAVSGSEPSKGGCFSSIELYPMEAKGG